MGNKRTPEIRFAGFTGDWEERKLGELIEISSAARVHKNEWTTSGVRFFRSSDVVSNFNGKKNTPAFISYSLYDELSKKSGTVQPGDILITGGGSIGIPYLVADLEPLYFKDADLIWLKSANKIDGYFLYSYFVTPQLRKYISSITHIGTISHYTIEQAKDTPTSLPKQQVEQEKISNFFKKLDETITLHQQELTILKQTKLGFLQKMFPIEGDFLPEIRFPEFTGEWERQKLGDITESYSGGTPSVGNKLYYNGNIPFIRSAEINSEHTELCITEDGFNNSSAKMVKKGDILYALYGATSGEIGISKIDGAINQAILVIKPKFGHDSFFIAQWLKKQKNTIVNTYLQGGQGNLSGSIVKDLIISLPTNKDEQVKIGGFLKQLDDIIALHQRELEALKETKKAFLQKMFV
ncbi:restriction endonuclease subunit S [Paenibacillus antarcticus]|uniref:Type I restriction modification DNA specificity domain-containing protein n=1 Tax=Paenibacillus antarcticus TaxID=253703 RepID=A0A168KB53_9BACL|nr:restriction endonuclease subunit S [Paenibacillus antarcticus]OAB41795.1 hypothetical protein PBAT_20635 [Paenibacillus antarcticus]